MDLWYTALTVYKETREIQKCMILLMLLQNLFQSSVPLVQFSGHFLSSMCFSTKGWQEHLLCSRRTPWLGGREAGTLRGIVTTRGDRGGRIETSSPEKNYFLDIYSLLYILFICREQEVSITKIQKVSISKHSAPFIYSNATLRSLHKSSNADRILEWIVKQRVESLLLHYFFIL